MKRFWCNGEWRDSDELVVSATDRGLLHGLGLFETILAVGGKPRLLERHLARLSDSCDRLGWKLLPDNWLEIMTELLRVNGLNEGRARIRMSLTAGSGALAEAARSDDAVLWLQAAPLADPPHEVTAVISPWLRNEQSPLAGLKCASYAENLLALQYARGKSADEALFFNTSGYLCEAATSNVFVVSDGNLLTPDLSSGCLPGVTRALVIELAETRGLVVSEGLLSKDQLAAADEVFLTSSTKGVVSLTALDERKLDRGPITQSLNAAWAEFVCHVSA